MGLYRFCLIGFWLGISQVGLAAAPGTVEEPVSLAVGTKIAPPFVIDRNGDLSGIAIDLWREIARALDLDYGVQPTELETLLDQVETGTVAVAAGALSVTAEREHRIDFTHPFYSSGLAIAVPMQGSGNPWIAAAKRFVSPGFFSVVLGLAALLFLVGGLVWYFEHRHNEEFEGATRAGLGAGFWWAAVTMTTVGYGDKSPRTLGGRLVALVWMFASIILISSFTAAIATSLTVTELEAEVTGPEDLAGARVATVSGSASEAYLRGQRAKPVAFTDLAQALTAVAEGRALAAVYDAPLLQYEINQGFSDTLRVLPGVFERQDYAFALPSGSALREPINRALLEVLADGRWEEIRYGYLGE